jgi:hypothetical protein
MKKRVIDHLGQFLNGSHKTSICAFENKALSPFNLLRVAVSFCGRLVAHYNLRPFDLINIVHG